MHVVSPLQFPVALSQLQAPLPLEHGSEVDEDAGDGAGLVVDTPQLWATSLTSDANVSLNDCSHVTQADSWKDVTFRYRSQTHVNKSLSLQFKIGSSQAQDSERQVFVAWRRRNSEFKPLPKTQ